MRPEVTVLIQGEMARVSEAEAATLLQANSATAVVKARDPLLSLLRGWLSYAKDVPEEAACGELASLACRTRAELEALEREGEVAA